MNIIKALVFLSFIISCQSQLILIKDFLGGGCNTVSGGTILKQSNCIVYNGVPSIFTVTESHGGIVQTKFDDQLCQENIIDKTFYKMNFCNTTNSEQPFEATITKTLNLPYNTIVSVAYTQKQCNGNFNDSFTSISYQLLDQCSTNGTYSSNLSCNEIGSTVYTYEGPICGGAPLSVDTYQFQSFCGNANEGNNNYLEFCNV
ncbi:hypothetical protein DICPUDRAFT_83371 [Dictyostelium purpureum]|uniref:Transmembrane protein n=1 Tax=Dictyostelium purpureum TaxID=5786 RepID=F0ZZC2_DICPU|nr:uncharacterized protein DICPUDRAFT_83371 [Dictyostelium purpureum]EGC30701.1 hypothetical protein DICPUDRAFT_83371 [Dictyostelium purpureum]|eukprot:XP_003292764.1 hypothetical protein DICPUDRAFT_83371 [Dictyostelium purpureum]